MEKCEYNCGKKAKFTLSNGKKCCSENYQSCPEIRRKNSEGLKKAYERGDKDTKHLDGNRAWNKNKTYEEVLGEKRAKEWKKKISEANRVWFENMTPNERDEYGKKVSNGLKNSDKNIGGVREGANKWRGCFYFNEHEDKEVSLDSNWEKKFVEYLDDEDIVWKRNTKKYDYKFEGQKRKYIPDFYLPNKEEFVEIKGFEREKDKAKWRDFPHDLRVLKQQELNEMGVINSKRRLD